MKVLKPDENKLSNYLKLVSEPDQQLLISTDGNFDENQIERLKEQILLLQKRYFEKESAETIKKNPPIEWHPYIKNGNISRQFLLLGTFPPPSYLIEKSGWYENEKLKNIKIGSPPKVDYFYGNMASLWKILDIEIRGVNRKEKYDNLLNALRQKNIDISDIILSCQRDILMNEEEQETTEKKQRRSSDNNLFNIVPNLRLIRDLISNTSVERIIFTSANWDVQKKGNIADNCSTLGIFLKMLTTSYDKVLIEVNDRWLPINELSKPVIREGFFIKYCKEGKKENRGKNLGFGYKAPNFLKIQIYKDLQSKEFILLGLPSPSNRTNQNLKNTQYFKLWKLYQEKNREVVKEADYRKHLYDWAFSNQENDLQKLFEMQAINRNADSLI